MAAATASELRGALEGFSGALLGPDDPGYDEARRVYNGLVDRRPALVARCAGTADVAAAVNAGREHGLELSVRGGGHNVGGRAVTDGGLMVDLSRLKGIFVDPVRRVGRAQGGVTWAELNRETQLHALAVTGGVISTTGIAGLTLGGGLGWTMGAFGMAVDNLLSAEVVLADGRVLIASEEEHPDLFWALRGGGGNFGVVTSFEYGLRPVGPIITGGLVVHPLAAAAELLRFYREVTADLPDEFSVFAGLVHAPDGSGAKLAALLPCHLGPLTQGELAVKPLVEFGSPLDVQVGPIPYSAQNAMLDAAYPPGSLNYWKSGFLSELSDAAIDAIIECFERCPSPATAIVLEHFHGAATRVPVEATAFPHREPGYNLVITSVWTDPAATGENVAWTRETFAALAPFRSGRRYVNYLEADDGAEAALAAFGPNQARLAELKSRYDPTNLFRLAPAVAPAPA